MIEQESGRKLRRRWWRRGGGVLMVILAVTMGFAYVSSEMTLRPERRTRPDRLKPDALAARHLTCQRWQSREGMPLLVCEPIGSNGNARRGTMMLLHGHKGCKEDMLGLAERFCAEGWRCIVPDLPGHGENPIQNATFGYRECDLIECMWRQVTDTHSTWLDEPLVVLGYSQGGAIALQLAARQHLPIKALVSVSAFDDLRQPIRASAGQLARLWPTGASVLARLCDWGIRWRGGFWPGEIRPIAVVERIHMPTLLIHGADDRFVPCAAALRMASRMKTIDVKIEIIEHAGHFDALKIGGRPLAQKMIQFIQSATAKS